MLQTKGELQMIFELHFLFKKKTLLILTWVSFSRKKHYIVILIVFSAYFYTNSNNLLQVLFLENYNLVIYF